MVHGGCREAQWTTDMHWDFASVFSNTDALLAGAAGTLRLFAICAVLGLGFGLVAGLARYSPRRVFYWPASAFVAVHV